MDIDKRGNRKSMLTSLGVVWGISNDKNRGDSDGGAEHGWGITNPNGIHGLDLR